MIHRLVSTSAVMLALVLTDPAWAAAQVQLASRTPRFVTISPATRRLVDASGAVILKRQMSLTLHGSRLVRALHEISRTAGIKLIYSRDLVPLDTPVTLEAATITLGAALTSVLFDTGLDVVISSNGEMALIKKAPISPVARPPTGSIGGRVTDGKTGAAVPAATVVVERTSLSATTDEDGRYRVLEVPVGTYTVRARSIGYAPGAQAVAVRAEEETVVDFTLEKSAQRLEEVVTTGTVVPTEVKALPTPVSVIDEEDIALQRPQSVQELFRKAVPGAVGWNYGSAPYQTEVSVRGASSISTSSSSMKIFVDGVDVAAAIYSQVDPNSIERVEVIRGPQAAAIYGSEAVGGVIQIFTKRGDTRLTRPEVSAEAGLGIVQTPYAGYREVMRQEYKASVRGGGTDVRYHLGAGYSHLGDWLPDGEVSRQSNPSLYAGVNFARGMVGIDISGRYFTTDAASNLSAPELLLSGYTPYSKPSFQPLQYQNQTVGARLNVTPTHWLSGTVRLGVDRYSYDLAQSRPRLTTPADTLLLVASQAATKGSIGLNMSIQGDLASDIAGSLTAGFDHWSRPLSSWYAFDAVAATGTMQTGASGVISATRLTTHNTGYFTQAQLGWRDALFLTLGLRAEQNTNFGDSLGRPLLPRVGLAYVQPAGNATFKVRGSWGRAIQPTSPGQKSGFVSATSIQLPNPLIGPERQQGWDAGIDATFGARGSLSVTYYDQVAENLVDAVVVALTPVYTQQFQNVGSVKNKGIEVEAKLAVGILTLQGQYGYTKSAIEQLSPTYAGDLAVGDVPLLRPRHTAGASASIGGPFANTTVSGGVVYVGARKNYDYLALYRCFGGTGPCRPTFRDYLMTYAGFAKLNLSVFQRITTGLSGFLSIDNLANNTTDEVSNVIPLRGRTLITGLRFQY